MAQKNKIIYVTCTIGTSPGNERINGSKGPVWSNWTWPNSGFAKFSNFLSSFSSSSTSSSFFSTWDWFLRLGSLPGCWVSKDWDWDCCSEEKESPRRWSCFERVDFGGFLGKTIPGSGSWDNDSAKSEAEDEDVEDDIFLQDFRVSLKALKVEIDI